MDKYITALHEICDVVGTELEDATKKLRASGGKLGGNDLEYLDRLTHTLKSAKTVAAMIENSDRSNKSGYYPPVYMGGMSYAAGNGGGASNRDGLGMSPVYGQSYDQYRDTMGRYASRDDSRAEILRNLHSLMRTAPDEQMRDKFQRFIADVEHS